MFSLLPQSLSNFAATDTTTVWHPIRHGVLYYRYCPWCRTPSFQRILCPICGASNMEERMSGGLGVVQQVKRQREGNVGPFRHSAVIRMDEGFSLSAPVDDVPFDPMFPFEWHVYSGMYVMLKEYDAPTQDLVFKPVQIPQR